MHTFERLGSSSQKYLLDCPAAYLEYQLNKGTKPPTDDMKLGSLVDMMLLEPNRTEEKFMRFPFEKLTGKKNFTTNENKAIRDEALQQAADQKKELITESEAWEAAEYTAERIRKEDSIFRVLTEPGLVHVYRKWESRVFLNDEIVSCPMNGELDFENPYDNVVVDIKCTNDISLRKFRRTVQDMNYHTQGYSYLDGYEQHYGKRPAFWFLAIDVWRSWEAKKQGLNTKWWTWYQLGTEGYHGLEQGAENHREAARRFVDCNRTGVWPAYEYLSSGEWKGLNVNQL